MFPRPSIQSLTAPAKLTAACLVSTVSFYQLESSSRVRHGTDAQSSQSLARAPLPRLPGRWSRSCSLGVLQVHGSTAMNPGRRQPWPLAMMGQKRAGHGLLPQCRSYGLAGAFDAAAKGLDLSAENMLAQAPGPADAVIPKKVQEWADNFAGSGGPLTPGETQQQPCDCSSSPSISTRSSSRHSAAISPPASVA